MLAIFDDLSSPRQALYGVNWFIMVGFGFGSGLRRRPFGCGRAGVRGRQINKRSDAHRSISNKE
ncbi:protein of unknown function [Hyphomicrobium sp. 1Nfss2.1]